MWAASFTSSPYAFELMNLTKEKLTEQLNTALANKEKMLGNLNAQLGYIQALQEMLAELDKPEPDA